MDFPKRLPARSNSYKPPSQPQDELTTTVNRMTAGVPSSAFLGIALAAMIVSLLLQTSSRGKWGNFIGQWVPSCLLFGLYSKAHKLATPRAREATDRGSYFL
jgi:hypothetical protein